MQNVVLKFIPMSSTTSYVYNVTGRRKKLLYILPLLLLSISVWGIYNTPSRRASVEPDLKHFRRSRNLTHYLKDISLLTEPSSTPCDSLNDVSLIVVVTSTLARYARRNAIRASWAWHLPTYFILGLNSRENDAANVHLEAEQYNDLIVYDFQEHYQNLTLKTALILKWTQSRCPSVGFLLKTDDDILVNPWIMKDVLKENKNAQLIGLKRYNVWLFRSEYHKWYLPRWLFQQDVVPEYLLGVGYLIGGKYIKGILDAAAEVPLINIEDIYFTYLVAKCELGLELTGDARFSAPESLIRPACRYWPYAVSHGFDEREMIALWSGIVDIAKNHDNNVEVCSLYRNFSRLLSFFL